MENKKTTDLLNLLNELEDGDYQVGGKYEQIIEELKTREPFLSILDEHYDESLPFAWKAIQELREEIKKLKRHKHDEKSGDVLIRI